MIEEFYLNNKIVSIHLDYMEEYNQYIWTDTITVQGFFKLKEKKLKEFSWINYDYFNLPESLIRNDDIVKYKNDDELLKKINPLGINKYSVHNKRLYHNPMVSVKYVNGNVKHIYFNKNSEAERYYADIKAKYNDDDYIVYD